VPPSPRPGWRRPCAAHVGRGVLSVHDREKPKLLPIAARLAELGFELVATAGTAEYLGEQGFVVRTILKVTRAAERVDAMINARSTCHQHPARARPGARRRHIRRAACATRSVRDDADRASAAVEGIAALRGRTLTVRSLQSSRCAPARRPRSPDEDRKKPVSEH